MLNNCPFLPCKVLLSLLLFCYYITIITQKWSNTPEFGGVCHLNFSSGPAKGQFCWNRQPDWSAYRESSFGHGILEVRP